MKVGLMCLCKKCIGQDGKILHQDDPYGILVWVEE